jgi:hypothetical protein
MEIVKTRRINFAVLFFSLLFLMGACAFAQVSRMREDSIVKRFAVNSIEIKNPLIGNDILLSVYSDSIDSESLTLIVYVYFPENINALNKNIVITYTDGTSDILQQFVYDKNDGYAEYEFVQNINNISTKKVDSILIRGVSKSKVINKSYFLDFFSSL